MMVIGNLAQWLTEMLLGHGPLSFTNTVEPVPTRCIVDTEEVMKCPVGTATERHSQLPSSNTGSI